MDRIPFSDAHLSDVNNSNFKLKYFTSPFLLNFGTPSPQWVTSLMDCPLLFSPKFYFSIIDLFSVLCVFGALVYRAQSLLPDGSSVALLLGVVGLMGSGVVVMFVGIVWRKFIPVALVLAAVVSVLSVQYAVLSRAGPEPVEVLAALIREAKPAGMPYGRYRVFVRNLVFYTGRPHVELSSIEQVVSFLRSSEPVLGVIDQDDLVQIRTSGVAVYELGRVSYLNTGNLNLGTLVRPNPDDDLRTVILVSNQPSASGAGLPREPSDAD